MASTSKKNFVVALAGGGEQTITGTHFVRSDDEYNVVIFDGDTEVAAFKNFQAIYPVQ